MITTKRCFLRPINPTDAQNIFSYRSNREVNQYQGWIPNTIEEVETFISNLSDTINIPDTWFQWVIEEKKSRNLIGDIGVYFAKETERCKIGCTLDSNYHGQGFATEVMEAVMSHVFANTSRTFFIASLDPRNTASINLVKKLGFEKGKLTKRAFQLRGEWVDDIQYTLRKPDYLS